MFRWFGYVTIFVFSAFVLHLIVEPVVTLVIAAVAPASEQSIAEPIVLVVELGLAGVVTWLIGRFGGQFTRSEEDRRRGDAFLEEERRRVDGAEQRPLDEERLECLKAEMSRWRQARELHASASEILTALGDGDAATAQGTSLREELQWALGYADRMSPRIEPQVTGTTPQGRELGSAGEGEGTAPSEAPLAP